MKGRFFLAVVLACLAGGAQGCGDGGASDDCGRVVDAFAKAWSRCMHGTYEQEKKTFSDAFQCDKASKSDAAQVDQCVNALNTLDCNAVNAGTSPGTCTGAVTQ
jgi:hypothetical protein